MPPGYLAPLLLLSLAAVSRPALVDLRRPTGDAVAFEVRALRRQAR